MRYQKNVWNSISLLMIFLVVSIPFYVSDVHAASVSITKNQGEKGVKGYIDADGDTWTVEATVYGDNSSTIEPKHITIKVGDNQDTFNSCSSGLGGTVCKYLSPLKDGITPGVYDFSVFYSYLSGGANKSVSTADKIKADGTTLSDGHTKALAVDLKSIKQEVSRQGIILDFTVKDQPVAYCSGLSQIEIIDAQNSTLQKIANFTAGDCDYDYKTDSGTGGLLKVDFNSDGYRWIKIKAADRLGHEVTSSSVSFYGDFTPPKIESDSLSLVHFGTYIGKYEAETDLMVNVTEKNKLAKVTATSSQTRQSSDSADSCTEDTKTSGLWSCVWKSVKVTPNSTVSLLVVAEDEAGNKANATLSKTLIVDSTAPKATSFSTARTYNSNSYVSNNKNVKNLLVLQISEDGSGMNADGIRASLSGLGGSSSEKPDTFNITTYEATWDIDYTGSDQEVQVGLSKFQDAVGNRGTMPQLKVQVDGDGPDIEKIEVYGLSTSAGEKDYFQSNDKISIEMKIKEQNGLLILVDLNDLVNDAETSYPDSKIKQYYSESDDDYSGWMAFTEKDCTGTSGNWTCKLETPAVKSGPDSSANLEIEVYDTAGNKAKNWLKEPKNVLSGSKGKYRLNLLGLDLEENPDYWEVGSVAPVGGSEDFIDMHTTQKIAPRLAFQINLKTNSTVQAAKIELSSCTPETGFSYKQREVLFDNLLGEANANPSPILILEMSPFDAKEYFNVKDTKGSFEKAELKYVCKLNIYSVLGKKAVKNVEVQEVKINVPFAYSELGSLEENLEKIIEDAKSGYYENTAWIGTLQEIIDWINYILRIVNIIYTLVEVYELLTGNIEVTSYALQETGEVITPLKAVAAALDGTCFTTKVAQNSVWKYVKYLQIPASILSCNPGGKSLQTVIDKKPVQATGAVSETEAALDSANWYFKYQRTVLAGYNIGTGRAALGIPAQSLYDNFYVSLAGLCVPGLIYNLKQLREIHCRKIVCLQKEVPQGVATVESCNQLYDLLECEFWSGPGVALIPGLGIAQVISDAFKSILTSPLAFINLAELFTCGMLCFVPKEPGALQSACSVVRFITKLLDIVDTIVGMVKNRPDLTSDPYCDMVEDLEESKEKSDSGKTSSTASAFSSSSSAASTSSSSASSAASSSSSSSIPSSSTSSGGTTTKS